METIAHNTIAHMLNEINRNVDYLTREIDDLERRTRHMKDALARGSFFGESQGIATSAARIAEYESTINTITNLLRTAFADLDYDLDERDRLLALAKNPETSTMFVPAN